MLMDISSPYILTNCDWIVFYCVIKVLTLSICCWSKVTEEASTEFILSSIKIESVSKLRGITFWKF
jgi:hypothetical protein